MSKKFEYPIEKFIYNDDYTKNDLEILTLESEVFLNKNEDELKKWEEDENKEEKNIIDDLWNDKIDGDLLRKKAEETIIQEILIEEKRINDIKQIIKKED